MKQTRFWLTTIAALLCSIAVNAHSFMVGGIYYTITDDVSQTVKVTFQGSYSLYENEYSRAVTIPSEVTYNGITYSVTSIGTQAFDGCSSLPAITLSESVTSIGDYAFYGCSSLTSITSEAVMPPNAAYFSIFSNVDKSIPIYVLASSMPLIKLQEYGASLPISNP